MLIVCGPSCSGKSTFGQIASSFGMAVVEGSATVKELYLKHHLPEEDIINFCRRWYKEVGMDVFARENHQRMLDNGIDLSLSVFIGCRAAEEVDYLKSISTHVRVIGLYCDTLVRFQRCVARNREDRAVSHEEFIRKDMREMDLGLARILAYSIDRLIISNYGSPEYEVVVRSEVQSYIYRE